MEVLRPASSSMLDIQQAYDNLYSSLRNHYYADLLTGIANEAFNVIKKNHKYWDQYINTLDEISILEGIKRKLNDIPKDQKITVEAAGSWIWLSENTFDNKETLKAIGFRYNRDKKRWFWSEKITKQYNTKEALGQHE